MATICSKASTTRWVAGILPSQVTSARALITRVGLENLPCEGGFALITADYFLPGQSEHPCARVGVVLGFQWYFSSGNKVLFLPMVFFALD